MTPNLVDTAVAYLTSEEMISEAVGAIIGRSFIFCRNAAARSGNPTRSIGRKKAFTVQQEVWKIYQTDCLDIALHSCSTDVLEKKAKQ